MKYLDLDSSLDVSEQVKETSMAIDKSIAEIAALTGSIVTAAHASQLAPGASQKVFNSMADSFAQLVQSREGFVAAHKHMITLKQNSNHVETDFGCLGDGPLVNPKGARLTAVS